MPAGTSVTWDKSPNIVYVSGQGTTSYTVTKGSNGAGFVTAVVNSPVCGSSATVQKNIQVGPETAIFSLSPYPTCGSIGTTINFLASISNVNYSWTVHGGTIVSGQGTQSMDARMTEQYMFVDCYVTGTSAANCYSPEGGSSVSIRQCYRSSAVTVSPNPASNSLNVELSEPVEPDQPVAFELRNDFGILVRNQTVNGNKFDIDTENLSRRTLHIKNQL